MAKTKSALEVDGRIVEVSNPDKIMFPGNAFTKAHVIDYYIRISEVLLPHLKDRALTMKRFPDGVNAQHFYEKDAPKHTPGWVKTFNVPRRERKGSIRFLLVNDLPTLVWTANLANLEMHVFLARAPHIQKPDFVVFDLDPGEPADVLNCAQVAIWLREILASMKLECWVKVSGSKGIQLYVPLNTDTNYEATGEFARSVAQALERLHPKFVVSSMAKNLRKGKVFIDWSQNVDFKTTVGVYSLRAKREVPYISMPVKWEEISAALKKMDSASLYFGPEAAIARVEKLGDLFAPVLKTKQKIPKNYHAKLKKTEAVSKPVFKTGSLKKSDPGVFATSQKSGGNESRRSESEAGR